MRRRSLALWVLACGLTCATAAAAQEDQDLEAWRTDYDRPGVYLEGMGLIAVPLFDNSLDNAYKPRNATVAESAGASGRIGYRIIPNLALEAQFEWLQSFDVKAGGRSAIEVRSWNATGNAKLYFATKRFQPYALAGIGLMRLEARSRGNLGRLSSDADRSLVSRFGAGFDYYVNRDVGLAFETTYVAPYGPNFDFDHISVGFGVFVRPGGEE